MSNNYPIGNPFKELPEGRQGLTNKNTQRFSFFSFYRKGWAGLPFQKTPTSPEIPCQFFFLTVVLYGLFMPSEACGQAAPCCQCSAPIWTDELWMNSCLTTTAEIIKDLNLITCVWGSKSLESKLLVLVCSSWKNAMGVVNTKIINLYTEKRKKMYRKVLNYLWYKMF